MSLCLRLCVVDFTIAGVIAVYYVALSEADFLVGTLWLMEFCTIFSLCSVTYVLVMVLLTDAFK